MPSVCFNKVRLNMLSPYTSADHLTSSRGPLGYMYSNGVISNGALGFSAERLDAITPPAFSRPIVHHW